MKFQKILLVSAIVAVGVSALFFIRRCGSRERAESTTDPLKAREQTTTYSHFEANPKVLQALLDSYKHSIELYGKVVDQFGEAVPDATVEIFVHSEHFGDGSGTDAVLKTDQDGRFSINGLTGGGIGASAMKEGYLRIPALSSFSSSANLSYTGGDGTGDKHADPSNPIVLELLKVGPTEPIVYVKKKRWKLPVNDSPILIALDSEKGLGSHQIEISFKSDRNKLPKNNEMYGKLFNWSFQIRVPGGGLVWDKSDILFEAPDTGYKESIRYEYTATMSRDEWERVRYGRYFVKFADGSFGRIQFSIDGGSDRSPLYMESWLNLKPGSRNLATETMMVEVIDKEEPAD